MLTSANLVLGNPHTCYSHARARGHECLRTGTNTRLQRESMAFNVSPGNKPIKSFEYSIVQANFDYLVNEIKQALEALTKKAYEKGLIDEHIFAILRNEAVSQDVKIRLLVENVQDKIDRNVRHFSDFIYVLRAIPILNTAADHLTQAMIDAYSVPPSHQDATPNRSPREQHSTTSLKESSQKCEHVPVDSGIIVTLSDESASVNSTGEHPGLDRSNETVHTSDPQDLQPLLNPTQAVTSDHLNLQELVKTSSHPQNKLAALGVNFSGTNLQGLPNYTQVSSSDSTSPLDDTQLQPPQSPAEEVGIVFQTTEQKTERQSIQETGEADGADVLHVQNGERDVFTDEDLFQLRLHIRNLKQELNSSETENQHKDELIRELQQMIVQLTTKMEDLLNQLEDKREEVVRITSIKNEEINSVKLECDALKEKYDRLKEQQARTEKEKRELSKKYENEVAEMAEQQAETKIEVAKIKLEHDGQINTLRDELRETTSQSEQAEIELAQLREQLAVKEMEKVTEVAVQDKKIYNLQLRLRDLQIELKDKEKQIAERDTQLAERDTQIATLKQKKAEEEKEKAEAAKEKAEAAKEKAEDRARMSEIQKSESEARLQEVERKLAYYEKQQSMPKDSRENGDNGDETD